MNAKQLHEAIEFAVNSIYQQAQSDEAKKLAESALEKANENYLKIKGIQ